MHHPGRRARPPRPTAARPPGKSLSGESEHLGYLRVRIGCDGGRAGRPGLTVAGNCVC